MAAISFKGRHFQHDMILQSVRWYLAYSLSYRDIEELMHERGFSVDHSTINRWVLHYSPQLEAAFRLKKKRVGNRWRMDETYIKVKGQWKYYYRAIDKQGNTIDFLLTPTRDTQAALRFLKKAINQNGKPSLINIDQSGANQAGLKQFNRNHNKRIKIRQCKYLNNIIEQDHRRIKRLARPMLGFKNFHAAQRTLAGIEVMAMIKKGQMKTLAGDRKTPAEMFYALAASCRPSIKCFSSWSSICDRTGFRPYEVSPKHHISQLSDIVQLGLKGNTHSIVLCPVSKLF